MRLSPLRLQAGRDGRSWPVVALLLVVVLVPTVGVLWFMSQAMHNEQLAVRQKLSDVYRAQLQTLQRDVQDHWRQRLAELSIGAPELTASARFAQQIRGGLVDSVVVYGRDGEPLYPTPSARGQGAGQSPSGPWLRAQRQEHSGRLSTAASTYAAIADGATDPRQRARALRAQARCLDKAGERQAAIAVLTHELGRPELRSTADVQGRLIVPSAQLRALQLLASAPDPTRDGLVETLWSRLDDYGEPVLPAAQRRFLMGELRALAPEAPTFPTQAAEALAARYLASDPPSPSSTSLLPTGLPDLWHLASDDGTVVALFEQRRLLQDFELLKSRQTLSLSADIELLAPGTEPRGQFVVSLPVGGLLRDWQLALRPDDASLFATAANQRIHVYWLIGSLVILLIALLAILVAKTVQRQLKLTRLKNDLLATVSHELKTPLASMRLLVDTLLGAGKYDEERVREYLGLIAKENVRLTRLVDNFLTFSRMEQNRHSLDKRQVDLHEVIGDAVDSVSERFEATGFRFDVEVDADLPPLWADADGLVTVVLNLLDNAHKYSADEQHIVLRAYAENDSVCLAVEDSGIGLSSRVAGKIFDRFYQVDQSLSRPGSGCGLGLSIVEFIVAAHGGSIDVESRLGEGSTFTVRLPVEPEGRRGERSTLT